MVATPTYSQRWWILGALCVALLMITIDNTIVNVALPTLSAELRTSTSELQWIVEAYSLLFAGLLLTGGALNDRFGSRRLFTVGLLIFGAASTLAAFVSSAGALIAARALMGLGGALIMPSTLATIKQIFPDHERAQAIGIWAATASIGVAGGPILGGLLLEHFWWGSIFLVNLPIVLVAIAMGWSLIPASLPTRQLPLDLVGAALSLGGIVALVYGVIEAAHWGWSSPLTLATIAGALLLLALFIWWELRIPHPMLQVRLFGNQAFSAGIAANLLTYMSLGGFSFILPQFLQSVRGYGPLEAGLRMLPLAFAVGLAGVAAGWLTRHLGSRATVASGLALAIAGLGLLAIMTPTSSYGLVLLAIVLLGLGVGAAYTAGTDAVMAVVPGGQAGAASATNEMSLELGTAFGIAVLGSVLTSAYARAVQDLAVLPETAREAAVESITGAVRVAEELGGSAGRLALEQVRLAFTGAMQFTTGIGIVIALAGMLIALCYLPRRSTARPTSTTLQTECVPPESV
ncbi:MAG: MFS transporter [Roseiflexaceae bacterium]